MAARASGTQLRLAEPLVALSLVTDLTLGYPDETAVRACLLSMRLAGELGAGEDEAAPSYWVTLLRYVGCTASSHEAAAILGGDDMLVNRRMSLVDHARPLEASAVLLSLAGRDKPLPARAREVARMIVSGKRIAAEVERSHCEVARRMAERFGLPVGVPDALRQLGERWDGKGVRRLAGEAIAPAAATCRARPRRGRSGHAGRCRDGGADRAPSGRHAPRSGVRRGLHTRRRHAPRGGRGRRSVGGGARRGTRSAAPRPRSAARRGRARIRGRRRPEDAVPARPLLRSRGARRRGGSGGGPRRGRRSRATPGRLPPRPGSRRSPVGNLGEAGAAVPERVGARSPPSVPERADPVAVAGARSARLPRGDASRAARRERLSPWLAGRRARPPRPRPGRRRRLQGARRAATAPPGLRRRRRRRRARAYGARRAARPRGGHRRLRGGRPAHAAVARRVAVVPAGRDARGRRPRRGRDPLRATVRATGRRIADEEIHLWSFDDSGKISAHRHFLDTGKHIAAYKG